METQEMAVPLAYFITFTCYGTWIHGEKEASVNRQFNMPGSEFFPADLGRAKKAKGLMHEESYLLDSLRRGIVVNAIQHVCVYRQWSLLAAHVRTNHVHMVVHALIEPERIMSTIKSYASRYLNEANLDAGRQNRWTRHGSTRYLWKPAEVEATIHYVIHEQGNPMSVFENKDRHLLNPF